MIADVPPAAPPSTAASPLPIPINPPAIALYDEAIRLGAMARACFEAGGELATAGAALRSEGRLAIATEALRVTARLLEINAALIVRQAHGIAPVRLRDDTPVPGSLIGPASVIADAVRVLYLRTFPI